MITDTRLKLRAAGFQPLPLEGKIPHIKEWQTRFANVTEDDIRLWPKVYHLAHNTGILTKHTPALDIDIEHPEAAEAIETLARARFGEEGCMLIRFGRAPRRAILLRTDEPFTKLTLKFDQPRDAGGDVQKIEVLGDGQQLAAFGIHPQTRQDYRWFGGEPGDVKREDLPYARREDVFGFLQDAERLLIKDFGFKDATRTGTERASRATGGFTGGPVGTERIASALAVIPADDREVWIEIGLALHSHLGEAGRHLWDQWSQTSTKYDPEDLERVWTSFGNRSGTTIRTLFHHAMQAGWIPPPLTDAERMPWSAAGYFLCLCPPRRAWRVFSTFCEHRLDPPIDRGQAWQIFSKVAQKDLF